MIMKDKKERDFSALEACVTECREVIFGENAAPEYKNGSAAWKDFEWSSSSWKTEDIGTTTQRAKRTTRQASLSLVLHDFIRHLGRLKIAALGEDEDIVGRAKYHAYRGGRGGYGGREHMKTIFKKQKQKVEKEDKGKQSRKL